MSTVSRRGQGFQREQLRELDESECSPQQPGVPVNDLIALHPAHGENDVSTLGNLGGQGTPSGPGGFPTQLR